MSIISNTGPYHTFAAESEFPQHMWQRKTEHMLYLNTHLNTEYLKQDERITFGRTEEQTETAKRKVILVASKTSDID